MSKDKDKPKNSAMLNKIPFNESNIKENSKRYQP
jgi:hypothetical protein